MYTWAWKKHIQIKTCSKHENQSQVVARRRGRERTHTHPESDLTPDSQCNPSHDPILKYLRWANSSKPVASRWGTWSGSRCKNRQVNPPRHPVQVLTTWLWFRHSGTVEWITLWFAYALSLGDMPAIWTIEWVQSYEPDYYTHHSESKQSIAINWNARTSFCKSQYLNKDKPSKVILAELPYKIVNAVQARSQHLLWDYTKELQ